MFNSTHTKAELIAVDDSQWLPLIVLGTGNIGQQFLKVLKSFDSSSAQLRPYRLIAVANSRYFQLNQDGLAYDAINLNEPNQHNHKNINGELYSALESVNKEKAVVIDLTASEEVAQQYLRIANKGWHIISANKIAAANHDWATSIESAIKINKGRWLKNTTVGAALPIQDSIKKVLESGDTLRCVSGVFSGSISWLLSKYDGQKAFMDWVKQAHENALTEPDPRADLSGLDVYRKSLILARACGFNPKDINFEPVLPQRLLNGTRDEFWQQEDEINSYIKSLWSDANKNQKQLRYLAEINADAINIKLKAVTNNHAAANLKAGDNIFIVESEYYSNNPLVIQGPGAGKEVTAAGVLSDLVELLLNP